MQGVKHTFCVVGGRGGVAKDVCLAALPSVSVSVESGCWTEGQGAGPVKY